MKLDKRSKRRLFAEAIEALHHDRTVDDEVQLDAGGFSYATVKAFSSEVRVVMKINISPCLAARLGLDTIQEGDSPNENGHGAEKRS